MALSEGERTCQSHEVVEEEEEEEEEVLLLQREHCSPC